MEITENDVRIITELPRVLLCPSRKKKEGLARKRGRREIYNGKRERKREEKRGKDDDEIGSERERKERGKREKRG